MRELRRPLHGDCPACGQHFEGGLTLCPLCGFFAGGDGQGLRYIDEAENA
jgi:hypothetical protein